MESKKLSETNSEGLSRFVLLVEKPEFLTHAAALANMYVANAMTGFSESPAGGANQPPAITFMTRSGSVVVMTNPTLDRLEPLGVKRAEPENAEKGES